MKNPIGFSIAESVIPTWLAFWTTTFGVSGSLIASIIDFSYGAFDVLHCPGSALDSLERIRNLSAHSLNEIFVGGRHSSTASPLMYPRDATRSSLVFFVGTVAVSLRSFVKIEPKFRQTLIQVGPNYPVNFSKIL